MFVLFILFTAMPSTNIVNVRVVSAKSTEVVLAWDRPEDTYNEIAMYEVRYFAKANDKNSSTLIVNKDRHETTITNLKQKTEYQFQVSIHLNKNLFSQHVRIREKYFNI